MTSPHTAQSTLAPPAHTYKYYEYDNINKVWGVYVPMGGDISPPVPGRCPGPLRESLGFYIKYDDAVAALTYYLSHLRETEFRLGIPLPAWHKTILALRIRSCSLDTLLTQEREEFRYQVAGADEIINELRELRDDIEVKDYQIGRLVSELNEAHAAAQISIPSTPPPTPQRMTQNITPMVDGEIRSPPALRRVHSWTHSLDGYDI